MKRWIQEALKKAGYFILIAVMLICSFPFQTITAAVSNKNQTVSEEQNKSAYSSAVVSSSSNAGGTENDKTNSVKIPDTEIVESTGNNDVTATEIPGINSTESMKHTDNVSNDENGNDVNENGVNTSEGDNSVTGSGDKVKTESSTEKEGDIINKTEFTAPDKGSSKETKAIVNFQEILLNELELVYTYNKETRETGYNVSIKGEIPYSLTTAVNSEQAEIDEVSRTEELSKYLGELTLYKILEDGTEEIIATDSKTLDQYQGFSTSALLTEDVKLGWKLAVYEKDTDGEWNKGTAVKEMVGIKEVVMPTPISLEVSNLELNCVKDPDYQGDEKAVYFMPVQILATIKINGIAQDGIPATERVDEIRDCLSRNDIELKLIKSDMTEENKSINLYQEKVVNALVNSIDNSAQFEVEHNYELESKGEYQCQAVLKADGNETPTASIPLKVTIPPLPRIFGYVTNDGKDTHLVKEQFVYRPEDQKTFYGEVSCYEVDETGQKVDSDGHLDISKGDETGTFKITGKTNGTYYIKFECPENNIYEEASRIYTVEIEKETLTATVDICSAQMSKFLLGFSKEDILNVTAKISSQRKDLFSNYYQQGTMTFTIARVGGDSNPIELGEVRKCDYNPEKGEAVYRYSIPEEIVDALDGSCGYQIQAKLNFDGDASAIYASEVYQSEAFNAQNIIPYIDFEEEQRMEFGVKGQKLKFSVYEREGAHKEIDPSKLSFIYESKNRDIVEVNQEGVIKAIKGGRTEITVTVDDAENSVADRYQKKEFIINVIVTPKKNTGYKINNNTLEEFLKNADEMVICGDITEYWYKDKITVCPDDTNYDEIVYCKDGGDWKRAKGVLELEASLPAEYEFYFCNEDLGLYSYDVLNDATNEPEGHKKLPKIGIGLSVNVTNNKENNSYKQKYFFDDLGNRKIERGFEVSASCTANYNFGDSFPEGVDPSDNNQSLNKAEKENALNNYTLHLDLDYKTDSGKRYYVSKTSKLSESSTITIKKERVTEDAILNWQFSVYKNGKVFKILETKEERIIIPKKISLKMSNLKLQLLEDQYIPDNDYNSNKEIKSYEIPVQILLDVEANDIEDSVPAADRKSEITYYLGQNKLLLREKAEGALLWDQHITVNLNSSDFAEKLVKDSNHKATFTYTTDKDNTVVVDSVGIYQFKATLDIGSAAPPLEEMLNVTIHPIDQDFEYGITDTKYIIGETYTFALEAERKLYGAVSGYESDKNGNPIKGGSLEIEMNKDGTSSTIKSNKNAVGTHYISYRWGGNKIYAPARRTYAIEIDKAKLTGNVTIYNVQRKGLSAFSGPDKADPFQIETTLKANQIELLKSCYKDITVKFSAVPNDSKDKTVELGEIKGNQAVCSVADKAVVYTYAVPEKRMNQLKGGSHYAIQANLVFENSDTFAYQGGPFAFENFMVQNIAPYIEIEDQQVEFGTEKNLAFTVYDRMGDMKPAETPLSYRFALKDPADEEVITIDENGVLHPVSSKRSVEVIVTVDDVDNETEDRYNETSASVWISVTSPQNTDYTINNVSKEEFIRQCRAFITDGRNKEYWYDNNITVALGKDNLYDEIVYRKVNSGRSEGGKADSEWINAGDKWVIDESSITDYEFYFCDTERNLYSYDVNTSTNLVKDALKTLDDVGVDKTAPDVGNLLSADRKANSHSTGSIHYFSDGVDFTAYSKGSKEDTASMDEGTGIEKVYVKFGNQDWQAADNVAFANRYDNTYTLPLDENKMYGTVSVKAVDYLGHESIAAVYKGSYGTEHINTSSITSSAAKVCIDKVHPVIKAVPYSVDANGKQTAYDGSWTNRQLQYMLELKTQQSSGIYRYQYTFVPRGSEFNPAKASWTSVSPSEMEVVFGTRMTEKNQNTYSGTFRYPDEGIDNTAVRPEEYEQKNGVIYFRAESNASLVTEERDIADSMQQVRIWQENIENPRVYADNRFDASTGWYNQKTGAVNLSFAYPEYQEEKYAPAVGVIYELHQKTLTEDTTVKKAFYKGILDENKGTVVEVSDYTRPRSTTSLSGDGTIYIDSDSINELVVYTQDFAGNKSDKAVYTVKADYNAPNQLKMFVDEAEQTPHTSLDERIAYRSFSRNEVTVKGEADYGISGKQNLLMQKCKNLGDWNGLSNAVSASQVTLAPSTRGFVYMYAVDGAGNSAEAWSDGIATDNQAPVGPDNSDISIQAFGANSKGFFNSDFKVAVSVKDAPSDDDYSGLNSVMYTVGRGDSETKSNVSLFQFDAERPFWEDIIKSSTFAKDDILVSAFENESNEAYLKVTAVDNAGNIKTTSQVFMIDVTKPVIDVTFDKTNENNSKYYNTDRTATIQITELNFDPNLVRFQIYKDGAVIDSLTPSTDSWVSAGGDVHTANITFHEDGDYTFSVECTDMADNFSEYQEKVEEFTIDQTIPEVEVSYDNDTAWKDSYFNAPRTATITVEEHNFDETAFEAAVSPKVSLGGWSHTGDTHKATLNFSTDEHYIYTLHCTDLAGNEMEPFEEEEFYIDTEEPEITITGVADQSANAGDVIPVVIANDTNYDESGIKITLQNSKGNQITLTPERTSSEGGHAYRLTGVNGQPDEIYTLTAAATDMAGNESEISYRFSLNRHGSTYDLSNMSGLVEKVYTRYADLGDLEILETNVDVIEDFTVYISRNGEMLSESQVNALPGTKDADTIYYSSAVSGNDTLGYQYRYTIYKENFEQEGVYNIMFYSKDRAGNEVNNTLSEKGAEITFVVDNTAPTVVMEGVEAGQFYAEDSKEVNVYTSDNFKLKKAEFYLVDETGATVQTYDYMELAENEGDVVTLILPNSDKKLSLTYSTIDAAGNNLVTLQNSPDIPSGFMITTNAWLRYINNNAAVAATVGGVGAAGAASAGGTALFRRRKLKRFHKK